MVVTESATSCASAGESAGSRDSLSSWSFCIADPLTYHRSEQGNVEINHARKSAPLIIISRMGRHIYSSTEATITLSAKVNPWHSELRVSL